MYRHIYGSVALATFARGNVILAGHFLAMGVGTTFLANFGSKLVKTLLATCADYPRC
jgi:hypothetical protein